MTPRFFIIIGAIFLIAFTLLGIVRCGYEKIDSTRSLEKKSEKIRKEFPDIEHIEAGIDQSIAGKLFPQELDNSDQLKGYVIIADRRDAIRTAVNLVEPGDILLIAGKGHEDYQITGKQKHHFSDREEVTAALKVREQKQGNA